MSESIQHNEESTNSKAGEATNRQITVDDNMTLMQELRSATLKKGCNVIQAEGVPNNVDLSSVMLAIRAEKPLRIVSKSYRAAETMNRHRAINEFKGSYVHLQYTTPFKLQTYDGTLLFVDGDHIGIERPEGDTMIARCPEAITVKNKKLQDLRESPALEFEIESEEDQEVELAVLFRSNNSFSCPITHNLVYDSKESVIRSLESNAQLTNRSGCDWSDVTIKIMTGGDDSQQNSRAKGQRKVAMSSRSYAMDDESAGGAAPSETESVGERKLFELPPGISLKNGDSKLIQLLAASSIPVTEKYYLTEGTFENAPARLRLSFKNLSCEKSCGLGKPIPAGIASIYQPDKSGSKQLTSQVAIADASIGDVVPLELGNTQDIKATRRLADEKEAFVDKNGKALSKKALADLEKAQAAVNNRRWVTHPVRVLQSFEVTIQNFKDQETAVSVPQSLGIGQKIVSPSTKFDTDKNRSEAVVKVPARTQKAAGKTTLTYIVETLQERKIQIGDLQSAQQ